MVGPATTAVVMPGPAVGSRTMNADPRPMPALPEVYASAFLHRVKELIETRDWSQEL